MSYLFNHYFNYILKDGVGENDVITFIDSREHKYELMKSVDMNGDTLLTRALRWGDKHPSTSLIAYLLRMGSDPNVVTKNSETPLMYACRYQLTEIISLLLSYGADTNRRPHYGAGGILYTSIVHGNQVAMRVLTLHGAQLTDREYDRLKTLNPKKNKMLTDFYDGVKLTHISYAHIKRLRYHSN